MANAPTENDQLLQSSPSGSPAENNQSNVCGINCRAWINWRGSKDGRNVWKGLCSVLLSVSVGAYLYMVSDSVTLVVMGVVFWAKLLIEIWGQDTPTWAAPGTLTLFVLVYVFGIPSVLLLFGYCRDVDVEFPYREPLALVMYLFGSFYSLGYEVHRFRWKAEPGNKGKLHTIGLARLSMHPNYFGDLFTYTAWGLATGTRCATSLAPASLWYFTLFVCPNSDAYLAQRYADEFPAYAASTASLIPGLRNKTAARILAWAGLALSIYLGMSCGAACGM